MESFRQAVLPRISINQEETIGAVVSIDDTLVHLLTGLNADQYAAEMTGQIAGG